MHVKISEVSTSDLQHCTKSTKRVKRQITAELITLKGWSLWRGFGCCIFRDPGFVFYTSVKESNAYISKSLPLLLPGLREQESLHPQTRNHHQRQPGDPRDAHVKTTHPTSAFMPEWRCLTITVLGVTMEEVGLENMQVLKVEPGCSPGYRGSFKNQPHLKLFIYLIKVFREGFHSWLLIVKCLYHVSRLVKTFIFSLKSLQVQLCIFSALLWFWSQSQVMKNCHQFLFRK